ncbi:hypothetical protein C2G38_2149216 [Gigaspora rosea]|uniref:Winged helix-turn helix domain-containing protein n=1 Tax=Gigaspora rosea TaxID=44941 RepID=A0A397U183_9GLOM|nr:hypothetical protein C2G38_2149216 [Gigaspora rosea]
MRGHHKPFNQSDMNILRNIIKENVNLYLDEIVLQMEIRCGKNVSIFTVWRSLAHCGITQKKLHKAAKERNELLRSAFMAHIGYQYKSNQLIFLDESSKDE